MDLRSDGSSEIKLKGGKTMIDLLTAAATTNPSGPTIDDIRRDAIACANAGINGIADTVQAGANMYNTMNNLFGMGGNPNPTNMGMYQAIPPQAQYAYAEGGIGYGASAYLNPMTQQMPMGYPGFADPDYGMGSSMGYGGFGGKL